MESTSAKLQQYYDKTQHFSHRPKTETAVNLDKTDIKVAIDLGCGSGRDIAFLLNHDYCVHAVDINPDSIRHCTTTFPNEETLHLTESSFESYHYPRSSLVVANSSLFFAQPEHFSQTWHKIQTCIASQGVFAGDFMGTKDDWANISQRVTTSLTKAQVLALFSEFDIIEFKERDELGKTVLGETKHWHIFSVVAVKK